MQLDGIERGGAVVNILFVEDDAGLIFLVRRFSIWQEGEFTLGAVARNGQEAMELLHKESFQAVLTDIRMPQMGGLELLRQIRRENIEVQVILASDYSDFSYAKEGLRLGAVDYLEKPYTEQKLREALGMLEEQEQSRIPEGEKEEAYQQLLQGSLPDSIGIERFSGIVNEENASGIYTELYHYFWQRINEDAICLKYLENPLERDGFQTISDYEKGIQQLEELIKKYHLEMPDALMNRIGRVLEEHIGETGVLDILSEEFELNKDYLSRLFREKWGMPLSEYITVVKMQKAKELLETTNYKVYEIAERLGYTTVDYFGRLFKNHVGCTPFQYKKHHTK